MSENPMSPDWLAGYETGEAEGYARGCAATERSTRPALMPPGEFHDHIKTLLDWRGVSDGGWRHAETNRAVMAVWSVWDALREELKK